jgi:hypothetical protein
MRKLVSFDVQQQQLRSQSYNADMFNRNQSYNAASAVIVYICTDVNLDTCT